MYLVTNRYFRECFRSPLLQRSFSFMQHVQSFINSSGETVGEREAGGTKASVAATKLWETWKPFMVDAQKIKKKTHKFFS